MAITKNSQIDLNGNEMILDADGDTKIDAATDDEIHFTVAGSETVYMGVTSYNASDRLVLTNTGGNASATIVAGTSGESSIFMADGTSGDASYRGYVQYQHTNDNFNIGTGGAQRLRIDSDGLKFGSDTAAANALDDYEEGTWTPIITGSAGSAGTAAYSNQTGTYTKIGDTVTFSFNVVVTNKGSWTGSTRITGFPFTAKSGSGTFAFAIHSFPDDVIGSNMVAGAVYPGTTLSFAYTGARLDVLHDFANIDTGYYLNGAGHYKI